MNGTEQGKVGGLLEYIRKSPTAFHAVETAAGMLQQAGYEELPESTEWHLKAGGKYYLTRNQSSVLAEAKSVQVSG